MQIREANVGDSDAIAGLLALLGYPDTGPFIAEKVTQQINHPDAKLLVAVEDGQIAGFISLHFIPQIAMAGDFCRISYLCVSDTLRGKGIGAALEEQAVVLARARGCDRIELHSHSRRGDAHRFYSRLGYEESPKYLMKMLK